MQLNGGYRKISSFMFLFSVESTEINENDEFEFLIDNLSEAVSKNSHLQIVNDYKCNKPSFNAFL